MAFSKKAIISGGKNHAFCRRPLRLKARKRVNFKMIILKEGKLGEYYERVSLIGVDKKDIIVHSAAES
ncbi:MAG: hypothetical protein EOM87_00180 [Clostridia bacterium]|nr:hypothetical protein [Clostridia bacterium]